MGNIVGAIIIKQVPGPVFYSILGSLLVLTAIATCWLKKPHTEMADEEPKSFWENIKSTLRVCVSNKMLCIMTMLIFSGTSIAFWSGMLTPIMVN